MPIDNVSILFQSTPYSVSQSELTITVDILNKETLERKPTCDRAHQCTLLIGDADGKVVIKVRLRYSIQSVILFSIVLKIRAKYDMTNTCYSKYPLEQNYVKVPFQRVRFLKDNES